MGVPSLAAHPSLTLHLPVFLPTCGSWAPPTHRHPAGDQWSKFPSAPDPSQLGLLRKTPSPQGFASLFCGESRWNLCLEGCWRRQRDRPDRRRWVLTSRLGIGSEGLSWRPRLPAGSQSGRRGRSRAAARKAEGARGGQMLRGIGKTTLAGLGGHGAGARCPGPGFRPVTALSLRAPGSCELGKGLHFLAGGSGRVDRVEEDQTLSPLDPPGRGRGGTQVLPSADPVARMGVGSDFSSCSGVPARSHGGWPGLLRSCPGGVGRGEQPASFQPTPLA